MLFVLLRYKLNSPINSNEGLTDISAYTIRALNKGSQYKSLL
jgi:hypothetical protein